MRKTTFQGFIDRIEGEIAVILLGKEEEASIQIPKVFLPPEAKEGTILSFKITAAPDKTREAKKKVQRMIEKLKNRNTTK